MARNSATFFDGVRTPGRLLTLCVLPLVAAGVAASLAAQEAPGEGVAAGDWPYFGGDRSFQRYSPLDQIDRGNVSILRIAWRRPGLDPELEEAYPELREPNNLRSTPVKIGDALYAPNLVGLLRAFDPATGETLWAQEPFTATLDEVRARNSRGIDVWRDGPNRRLFLTRGQYLYSIDAETGVPDPGFGDEGRVDLRFSGELAGDYGWTAGPIVVDGVVVVAGITAGAGDGGVKREATPEDVRGYDARTGRQLWTFHVVPRPGEPGHESWGDGSWEYSGDLGSWCCISADPELGYVYVPLSAPTAAYFGGHRPGDNLYSNTLVALEAKTGRRVWHFQMVHHDVWEWDTVGPATLGDITVDGRTIPAVMQPSKTGFLYVFDRRNGEPVWPIEERPVPPSTVPGERLSPTQPWPTKPPPFDRQGLSEDDLIDFTPELRARALELVEPFVLGPMFAPPSLHSTEPGAKQGTLTAPGWWGSGNWNTGAFDPETGMYYAVSHTWPTVYRLERPEEEDATLAYKAGEGTVPTLDGLPIVKPPYGRITAIDLNRGEIAWMVPNGDGPRRHPLLVGLDVPPLGVAGRGAPLVTGSLLFVGEGSDTIPGITWGESGDFGNAFRAFDKATGEVVWEQELPAGVTSAPMTYLHEGKQYIVVAVGGRRHAAEWFAFTLP
ncbi:MAG: PQQ-binding-like beta-propeller repeat protein [Thermoanaerobaculia bacterium]|nr:PQQ-binding-like beta-propeller repeat protein [Thermoanaerobaculia bacterium]